MTSRPEPQRRSHLARFCISTALAAGLLTGCTAAGPHPAKFAANAQTAIAHGQIDKAVNFAEQAVQSDGRNAAYRLLLGNAYFRAGRFESASQSFADAMALGEDSGKTALSLALAQIATGRGNEAVDTLNTYRDTIPAADLGLALAMAGQTRAGVVVLTEAMRRGEKSPKVRQNLAFAYALDGSWREAKVMAAQDVPADQLSARLQQWLAMAKPEDDRLRVATLLGVPMRGDTGQPEALALANFPAQDEPGTGAPVAPALAEAAMQPPLQATELPAADMASAQDVAAPSTPSPVSDVPTSLASIDLPASASRPVAPAIRPRATTVVTNVAVSMKAPAANGKHVVQLGAFSTAAGAKRAWQHFAARNSALAGYRSVIAHVTVNGHQFWRVQAAGFAGRDAASAMCGTVRASGGVCMVMGSPAMVSPQGRPAEARFARR
jgi:Flp pilus assembly protein TadD